MIDLFEIIGFGFAGLGLVALIWKFTKGGDDV